MKKCPFCAEEIRIEAIKCRFCGEFLDNRALSEASLLKKEDRQVFNKEEVAEYLRVLPKTIDDWVKQKKMPFSRLNSTKIVYRRKAIDEWIGENKITEYHQHVYAKKTIDDILPHGFKPPTDDEMLMLYVERLHEKYIARHSRKDGVDEAVIAGALSKSISCIKHGDVRFDWDIKKRKYVLTEGKESYNQTLKNDEGFQFALYEMKILMQFIQVCY